MAGQPKKQIIKSELIKRVEQRTQIAEEDIREMLDATLDEITKAVHNGEEVKLLGFGSFGQRTTAERQGLAPKTREPITIAASSRMHFKASKATKPPKKTD